VFLMLTSEEIRLNAGEKAETTFNIWKWSMDSSNLEKVVATVALLWMLTQAESTC
jgi:hypothetical protein